MNFSKSLISAILAFIVTFLSSCELIGDIFQAGVGVGIFAVLGILVLIGWLIMKLRK